MRTRSRWLLLAVLCGGLAAFVAVWTVVARSAGHGSPDEDARYVEAVAGAPNRLNPLFAGLNDVDHDLVALIFSGLTRLDAEGRVVPDLAEGWDISADGKHYTFHLRQGALWHDRQPVTADDVVFTVQALGDPGFRGDPALNQIWRDVRVAKVDETTVRFDLPAPYAPFLAATTIGIVPAHLLQGLSADALFDHPFNRNPVGTGPFRLVEMTDTHATLERYTLYHGQPPHLAGFGFRFYRDDQAAIQGVLAGQADGVLLRPVAAEEDLVRLAEAGMQLIRAPRNTYTILYLNTRGTLFTDARTRSAVALAIDRQGIAKEILHDQALVADTPILPGTWAQHDGLEPLPYDPDQAVKLLARAGWKADEEGHLVNQKGTPLAVTLLTNNDPVRVAIATRITEQLNAVGIQAKVSTVGASALLQQYLLPRKYEAALYGWDVGPDPDPYPAWHSSQVSEGKNLADYASEEADAFLEEGRKTHDALRRQELYRGFQEVFTSDVPGVIIYYPVYLYAVRNDLQGVDPGVLFDPSDRFRHVEQWQRDGS